MLHSYFTVQFPLYCRAINRLSCVAELCFICYFVAQLFYFCCFVAELCHSCYFVAQIFYFCCFVAHLCYSCYFVAQLLYGCLGYLKTGHYSLAARFASRDMAETRQALVPCEGSLPSVSSSRLSNDMFCSLYMPFFVFPINNNYGEVVTLPIAAKAVPGSRTTSPTVKKP